MSPLVFHPILKRIRWGGRSLGHELGKPIGEGNDYAESWEIVDLDGDQSIVSVGSHAGTSLSEIVDRQNLPLFGRHAGRKRFPLLVKLLDARDILSVQVHPDDQQASKLGYHNGKSEAWVILDAEPGSVLYAGLKSDVTPDALRTAIAEGQVESLLHCFPARVGDCIFVPAGTVHAIGGGVLLAEIQQPSDLTYRLYDWERVDSHGRPRQLHIEEAMGAIDFHRGPVDPVRSTRLPAEHILECLLRSSYFVIHRHRSDEPFALASDETCHVLIVESGHARLEHDGTTFDLPRGQTVLLPADRLSTVILPERRVAILDVTLP